MVEGGGIQKKKCRNPTAVKTTSSTPGTTSQPRPSAVPSQQPSQPTAVQGLVQDSGAEQPARVPRTSAQSDTIVVPSDDEDNDDADGVDGDGAMEKPEEDAEEELSKLHILDIPE